MAQVLPIVISGAMSAGGAVAGGAKLGTALVMGGLGTAVASLGYLDQNRPKTGRGSDDVLLTGASAIMPVPILLGRARLQTVIIASGGFHFYKSGPENSGQRYHVANVVVALAEGPGQAAGNWHFDGQTFADVIQDQPDLREAPQIETMFVVEWRPGTSDVAAAPDQVLDVGTAISYGFTERYARGEAGVGLCDGVPGTRERVITAILATKKRKLEASAAIASIHNQLRGTAA